MKRRDWARGLKRDVIAIWLAARDPRVPWPVKGLAAAVAAYALSPIDLIPDFIPVLGLLDDLLVVPAGIWIVVRLIPAPLMEELRKRAAALSARPSSVAGAIFIGSVWIALSVAAWLYWSPR